MLNIIGQTPRLLYCTIIYFSLLLWCKYNIYLKIDNNISGPKKRDIDVRMRVCVSHTWTLVCDGSHMHTSSQQVCFI